MLASEGRAWVSLLSERWYIESVVPRAGVEPAWAEAQRILSPDTSYKLLNKLSVTEIAELSRFSKSYISQVKTGIRPPSKKLLEILARCTRKDKRQQDLESTVTLFLKSRSEGTSSSTLKFYEQYLAKSLPYLGMKPSPKQINQLLHSLTCSQGGKHAYFRVLKVFYNWLYSQRSGFGFESKDNPVNSVDAPKVPKLILPSLTEEQAEKLMERTCSVRDKAIISLFIESGLRLSELAAIKLSDIDWKNRTIKTIGKGNKEGYAPFGSISERYLRAWLAEYQPYGTIWGMNKWGITTMLRRLEKETGLPCNPHTFRRTFACLLRKAGVDTMTIKDLGRWESLEMVQRYTRSVTFEDAMKHYKAPLS